MKSGYKLGERVNVTSMELYPEQHHLMGKISQIHIDTFDDQSTYRYDISYGITGIPDLKNVPESDIKLFS